MTLYLLNQWKSRPGGPQDPTPFMLTLQSDKSSLKEKELIINAFDDWEILTPTWFEVADYLSTIEKLSDDEQFPQRNRAALLSSKVAFCLGDYPGALQLALAAGDKFSLTPKPPTKEFGPQDELFVDKIIEQALDTYKTSMRNENRVDPRLNALIDRIFQRTMDNKEFRYVIALALDTRRIDMIKKAVKASDDQAALLTETVVKVLESQLDVTFREKVLDIIYSLFAELEEPDFVSVCQCLIKLKRPEDVAEILHRLMQSPVCSLAL
jgi:26S proteasome regulatory subunit N2